MSFLSSSVIIVSLLPLYYYRGGYIQGYIGLTSYRIAILERYSRIAVLDSIVHLSLMLLVGSFLSIALTVPSMYYSVRGRRVARIALEAAVVGYIVAGLTLALFLSSIRVLLAEVALGLPVSLVEATRFGQLVFHASRGGYTSAGLYALEVARYSLHFSILLVVAAGFLHLYIQRYYEDLLDMPLIDGNFS